jgi:nucleoside-diphosphate-sugar epimerase
MRITITGVTGFVGSNLFEYFLDNGWEPKSLKLRNPNWKSEIDPNASALIHLAGKSHDLKNSSNPDQYFDVNTKLTIELFDFFLASNYRDFIFFSSVKAVTDNAVGVVTEETITLPKTVYGRSKLQAEQYILSKTLPQGKRIFIIRPTMIHGPSNKGNLNLLFKMVSKGFPWPLGAFENQRSFCSIDNVCFVIKQILESGDITSGIYNLTDNQAISTNRIIELMAISQNKKAKIHIIPQKIINTLANLGDIFRLPLNSERLEKLTENFVVSNKKIVKAIGKELPVSTEDGLMKTFNSFN